MKDEYVDVSKLPKALLKLKELGNPHYQFVNPGDDYLTRLATDDPEGYRMFFDCNERLDTQSSFSNCCKFCGVELADCDLRQHCYVSYRCRLFYWNMQQCNVCQCEDIDMVTHYTNDTLCHELSVLRCEKCGLANIQLMLHHLQASSECREYYIRVESCGFCDTSDTMLIEHLRCATECAVQYGVQRVSVLEELSVHDDEATYLAKDPIRRNQFDLGDDVCLVSEYQEMAHYSGRNIPKHSGEGSTTSIQLAPAESKVPTSIMREKDWDCKAFPTLYVTGKYGIHHEREIKLLPQNVLVQRILNFDKRFSQNSAFIFAALNVIERFQLERQSSISCRRGKVYDGKLTCLEDAFQVFNKVKGTPKYWQLARDELIAKLEQLGPFQFFFTLSCADKRWPEILTTIFMQNGKKVRFAESEMPGTLSYENAQIYVDDEPLERYLVNKNVHEIIRENVLTVTRIFDHRVQMFRKEIIMGKNSPFHVKYFNYRVEFQLRGAGHIHGVLWCDLNKLEGKFTGLKSIMLKLRTGHRLIPDETAVLSEFIDTFVTCSLTENTLDIVKEVQVHHHTKSCRKYGTTCTFSYPKFPSEKTIISQPLSEKMSSTDKERILKTHKITLAKVKAVLNDLTELELSNLAISDVLQKAKITESDYYHALSVTKNGTSIILRRSVAEIYVNNYNAEWLVNWNGNMDLSVCLDYFAIITYITDYATKDETNCVQLLTEVAKNCAERSLKDRMKCLADAFLKNRQIGICEAYYRMIPTLHLRDSNIKTIFVASGFPKNRSQFLVKIPDPPNISDSVEDDNGNVAGGAGRPIEVDGYEECPVSSEQASSQ